MMRTVLVVDDEPIVRDIVVRYLEQEGYRTLQAGDGETARGVLERETPSLVVLDLMLPGTDGLSLCRWIRERSDLPVIMVTALGEEADRLAGLELGADDYLTKPFSPRELVARVKSVLRRVDAAGAGGDVLRRGDLVIDFARMQVSRNGAAIDLTPTEFQLFAALARQPGRIFTRAQLLDAVRGTDVDSFERAIDTHIKNLRRKVEPDSHTPRYILTVYGMGYKFAE